MRKKVIVISSILAVVLIGLIVLMCMPRYNYQVEFEKDIIVQDGVAQEEALEYVMVIPKDGDYVMHAEWKISPEGMLMGCSIRDENGKDVNTFSAHWITMSSGVMSLKAGKYTMTLTPLTNAEQWREYFADVDTSGWDVPPEESGPAMELLSEGEFHFEFEFKLEESADLQALIIVLGTVLGVMLVILLIAVAQTDDTMKQNYDERQELLRGRGAKYAFYTMMIFNLIMFMLEAAEVVYLPMSTGLALFFSVLIGGGVYAVYCIWKDAYFALNQKVNVLMVILIFGGVVNLLIGIDAILEGGAIQNNQLTLRSMNLFCGIMMLLICGVLILKKLWKDREEE